MPTHTGAARRRLAYRRVPTLACVDYIPAARLVVCKAGPGKRPLTHTRPVCSGMNIRRDDKLRCCRVDGRRAKGWAR